MKTKKDETTHKAATPFARFQNLIRGIVAVPKKEIEAEDVRWRANRRLKKKSGDT
jgi:hypothetical protein